MPVHTFRLSRNAIHAVFFLATLLVALVIYLTCHLDRRYGTNTRLLIRTHQLLTESERLYSLLKDCQRGYRGYLLTHDKALLEPYLRARRTLPARLARVGTLTGPHAPQQQARLAALRVLTGQSLAHWDNVIRLHDQVGPEAALAVVKAGRGRRLVDRAYGIIAGFQAHERRLLTGQQARYEKSQRAYTLIQLVGGSVGLLLLSFSFVLLRGRLKQKEQWGRQLEAKNRELAEGEEDLRASNEALLAANQQLEASVRTVERLSAEALQQSERQYRDLAESIPDPVVVYDGDLRYVLVNRAVEKLTGLPAAQLLGKTSAEAFGEAQQGRYRKREEACRQVMATGVSLRYEETIQLDGKTVHADLVVYPTAKGGTFVIARDVTALVEARRQYQELADSITDPVVMVDGELRYRYANKAFAQIAGRPAADLIGKTPLELFGEPHGQQAESARRTEAVRRVFGTRQPETLVSEVVHGAVRKTMEYALYPTASGNVLVITRDITARVEAEQQYRDLAESLTLPLVVYNRDLRYQYVNKAVEQLNGMPAGDLLGKTGREVFGEAFAPREKVCRQVMATGRPVVYREHPVRDGKRHHWELAVYPTGRGGTLVLNHDITELVEARHQLQEQQEELKASYAALEASEGRLRRVLDSMFIFAGLLTTEGELLYTNSAPLNAVGVGLADVLGRPFVDTPWFHAEEERQKLKENLARAARGETVRYDTHTLDHDGNMLYLDLILGPLRNEQGEVVQIIGSGVDVTARQKAEVALRESEQKFRSLFEANQDALFLLDVDSSAILDVNPTACQVYGYSRAEMLSMRMTDLSAQPEQTARAPRLRVGKVASRRHLRKDGTVFPVELSLTYYDQQGRQLCFVSSRDITERVQAMRKLETEKQRLELALWGADLGMWDWHIPSGEVVRNERHERMLGYEPGELTGTADTWVQSLHPDDLAPTTRALAAYLEGKTDHYRTEHRLRAKSGDWIWMQGSGKVVERDADGKPLRMIGIQQDISERKRSDESLRFYKYLIDNSPDPIYWIDPHNSFRFAYANEAACRHYGLSRQELLTRSIPDWDPTFTPERCQAHLAYMRTRRHKHFETVHRAAGGKEVPVEVSSFLLVYQGKEYLAGYFRNIAERLEGARKLEEEKQRLELALKGADMGLWDWNVPTGEVLFSERCATMFGYEPGELRPHANTWAELGHAEDTPHVRALLQAHLDGRTALFRAEHRVRCKDGGWKWILDSGKVIARDDAGRPLRMVGTYLDITTRKRAEGEIRKLATVAQKTDNAVIITDASGRIEWVNDSFTRISGYAFEEAVGHKPGALLQGPDTDPAAVRKMGEAVARHEGVELEVLNYAKDGKPYWLYLSIQPVFDDNGVLRQFIAIETDITGRKKAEATILELNAGLEQKVEERTAQLQAVNKELEAFSYSVSHDLRSPLRSIDGFSKMLLKDYEDKLDEDGKDYLLTIRQATGRMGHLIDDLLKLSKVSRTELNRFEVNLSEMAAQILGELGRETPERQVVCQVMPGLVAHVDHRLLHIALQNLLSNAWKYSSKKEAATIEVGKVGTEKGEAYFVRDNGAGFDMRNVDKLFGAFQRLHTTREFEGTGIGLAIVQRIILKHGGEIWAEAATGQGATFFFTLPGT
jgi:PAS domain S-box-containing protein